MPTAKPTLTDISQLTLEEAAQRLAQVYQDSQLEKQAAPDWSTWAQEQLANVQGAAGRAGTWLNANPTYRNALYGAGGGALLGGLGELALSPRKKKRPFLSGLMGGLLGGAGGLAASQLGLLPKALTDPPGNRPPPPPPEALAQAIAAHRDSARRYQRVIARTGQGASHMGLGVANPLNPFFEMWTRGGRGGDGWLGAWDSLSSPLTNEALTDDYQNNPIWAPLRTQGTTEVVRQLARASEQARNARLGLNLPNSLFGPGSTLHTALSRLGGYANTLTGGLTGLGGRTVASAPSGAPISAEDMGVLRHVSRLATSPHPVGVPDLASGPAVGIGPIAARPVGADELERLLSRPSSGNRSIQGLLDHLNTIRGTGTPAQITQIEREIASLERANTLLNSPQSGGQSGATTLRARLTGLLQNNAARPLLGNSLTTGTQFTPPVDRVDLTRYLQAARHPTWETGSGADRVVERSPTRPGWGSRWGSLAAWHLPSLWWAGHQRRSEREIAEGGELQQAFRANLQATNEALEQMQRAGPPGQHAVAMFRPHDQASGQRVVTTGGLPGPDGAYVAQAPQLPPREFIDRLLASPNSLPQLRGAPGQTPTQRFLSWYPDEAQRRQQPPLTPPGPAGPLPMGGNP